MYKRTFTDEMREYIFANYIGCGGKEMAERLNNMFGTSFTRQQVTNFYGRNKLNSGLTGRFEKGHTSIHKGEKGWCIPNSEKTRFKKGNIPVNANPIGSEIIDKDGYTWIRVPCRYVTKSGKCKTYITKQQYIWEQEKGELPDGHKVIFLDGDKTNFDINNLALVSDAEHLEMIRKDLRTNNAELMQTGILIARINCTVRKKDKRGKAN